MVVHVGSNGSLCMYYQGKLRASFPLNDKGLNVETFYNHANEMIVDALKDKQSLNFIKVTNNVILIKFNDCLSFRASTIIKFY